ncbi:MAG: hypothetical protein HN521_04650, partial [Candidatus Latescibacteria bacterium]|nr:hypothetical protein [Candidatus Latescibacterota bacterium]
MYQIIQGDSRNLADVTAFIDIVNGPEGQAFFDGDTVIVARAPGRLDVMGGIADYS